VIPELLVCPGNGSLVTVKITTIFSAFVRDIVSNRGRSHVKCRDWRHRCSSRPVLPAYLSGTVLIALDKLAETSRFLAISNRHAHEYGRRGCWGISFHQAVILSKHSWDI
jgi:hypothetical protein